MTLSRTSRPPLVSLADNFDLSLFIAVFAILERVAQEVLKTLRQAGRIGFYGRQILIDVS